MKAVPVLLCLTCGCADVWGFEEGDLFKEEQDVSSNTNSSSSSLSSPSSSSSSSSSISSSNGGAGGTGQSSSSSSTAGTTGGAGGSCVPTTCGQEAIECGFIDDGCDNVIDCGPFTREPICDADSGYTCACPEDHFYAYDCISGPDPENGPPPSPDCILNPNTITEIEWCCKT